MKHLGEKLDIHCGGIDNIFPHHTNEIAQSESFLGHKWCNYWFHVHHLTQKGGAKMSKSSGEFLCVDLLEKKGYNPLVYRFFCLQSHYRKPLEFSFEVMDNVKAAYDKLKKQVARIASESAGQSVDEKVFNEYKEKFIDTLGNDLNTSSAITLLYEVLKADINNATKKAIIESFDEVLNLDLLKEEVSDKPAVDAELEAYILERIEARKEAKKNKDFATADAIREELAGKGIVIKDTREGTVWSLAE
jgi:cysteinyl-tRNA synthetase